MKPGDPSSGLLPLIQKEEPGEDGAEDRRVQAYNLRLCTTDVAANRKAWPKPADYDEKRWELLFRNCEAPSTLYGHVQALPKQAGTICLLRKDAGGWPFFPERGRVPSRNQSRNPLRDWVCASAKAIKPRLDFAAELADD